MKTSNLLAAAAVVIGAQSVCATTLTFDAGTEINVDIPSTYGSYIASNSSEFVTTDGSGSTPNIGLTWAPTPNVWEFHSSTVWSALDVPVDSTVHVAQMDLNLEGGSFPPDPTITLTPDAGYKVLINSLRIGHATDQTASAFSWTITVERVSDNTIVSTSTTSPMVGGDAEDVIINFTGDLGVAYRLRFDDGGANTFNGAIDNLSFSQIPEPSSTALIGFGCLALILRRRK